MTTGFNAKAQRKDDIGLAALRLCAFALKFLPQRGWC
jgi:hypothetical protein